jgi:putative glutamine amidotransferase
VPKKVAVTYEERKKAEPYVDAMRLVGLDPVLVSADDHERSLKGLDGLLLTGGRDIDPKLYGQEPVHETQQPNPARDRMEIGLLGEALDHDLPVLAICRGIQLLNVYHGGTLIQHLPGDPHRPPARPKADPSKARHNIVVTPGTGLAAILGAGQLAVNSRHHQAVDKLGHRVVVSAKAIVDGIIEGLELPDKDFVVAVQWHPEDQVHDETQVKLFRAFAEAVESGRVEER